MVLKKGEYNINPIYQGSYSTMDPGKSSYGKDIFTGYNVSSSKIGAPTKPDTANQIQHVTQLLNQGIVPIEVGAIKPEIFDQIPKHHFKEINRMSKLTGADISVHSPIVEPSGIDKQGYDEGQRKQAEEQLSSVVDKAVEMSDKPGMNVTIHGAGSIPGVEYIKEDGKKKKNKFYAVNKETGEIRHLLKDEKKFYPSTKDWEKGTDISPERQLKMLNDTEWDNKISQLVHFKERADEIISRNIDRVPKEVMKEIIMGRRKRKYLKGPERESYDHLRNAQHYLSDAQQNISGLFNKAYQFADSEEDKKRLREAADKFKKKIVDPSDVAGQSDAISNMINALEEVKPTLFEPVEDFAIDKSSETFSNVALNAYKKHKDKPPVISIENMFPGGMAFSYGEELNNLVMSSKKKFVDKAVSDGVMSESKAKKVADKMLGVTLDVGHLNMARKHGFEEKDLMKEVDKIKGNVKHVHLTDNFGSSDAHLPPGMGNVPTKEILEKLDKEGKGDVKKIVEAGGFVQHFKESPFPYSLDSLGAGFFAGGTGQEPYWNQKEGLYQGYSGGFGRMLPSTNYNMFGANFSQLPTDLGGSVQQGKGSRMSGRPME